MGLKGNRDSSQVSCHGSDETERGMKHKVHTVLKHLIEFIHSCTKMVILAIKAYVGKSKINSIHTCMD